MPAMRQLFVALALLSCTALISAASKFAAFTTCDSCIDAGFGWSTKKNKCGGYPNKKCPASAPAPVGAACTERPPSISHHTACVRDLSARPCCNAAGEAEAVVQAETKLGCQIRQQRLRQDCGCRQVPPRLPRPLC